MPKSFSLNQLIANAPADKLQNIQAILNSENTKSLATYVIIIVGIAGLIGMTLTIPNAVRVLAPFIRKRYGKPLRTSEQKQKILQTFYYLKRTGRIEFKETDKGILFLLTKRGSEKFTQDVEKIKCIKKPNLWPRTWWLVAADIPTKQHKTAADMLRRKLLSLRFYPLQRSIWIHPFDPRQELEQIVNQYHISRFATIMEIRRLDIQDEEILLKHFKQHEIL